MSVPHSLLALLERGSVHGYGLKSDFEAATGGVWPLNEGQVYTTLGRLERDGLVSVGVDSEGKKLYGITDAGRAELWRWFETPVERDVVPRQELAIKLVFAVRSEEGEVAHVIQRQRTATLRSLQELTRLKANADDEQDLAWVLVLDGLVFQAEAEVHWLELCEARLVSRAESGSVRRRQPAARPVERSR
jgi:DNA-binding PadR family transcriptional regulator